MTTVVQIEEQRKLEDYAAVAHLAPSVHDLKEEASRIVPQLKGRTIWMVNSTSRGGGVAEMLPTMVALLRDLGVKTEWVTIESDDPDFFTLTKRLHNMIHGEGGPSLPENAREVYEEVNRINAEPMKQLMKPGDILVVHDPQPMSLASILKEHHDIKAIWRCHIGLDEENAATRAAWDFLAPYGDAYDHAVFSAPEYIPQSLAGRSTVIYPAINPLSEKNQDLHLHKLIGILSNSALIINPGPLVRPPSRTWSNGCRATAPISPRTCGRTSAS